MDAIFVLTEIDMGSGFLLASTLAEFSEEVCYATWYYQCNYGELYQLMHIVVPAPYDRTFLVILSARTVMNPGKCTHQ